MTFVHQILKLGLRRWACKVRSGFCRDYRNHDTQWVCGCRAEKRSWLHVEHWNHEVQTDSRIVDIEDKIQGKAVLFVS